MRSADLVSLRKTAEEAVADMVEGPLKVKAFEVILGSLLEAAPSRQQTDAPSRPGQLGVAEAPMSLAERIATLAEEGFFAQPRSLTEIQSSLAKHGWHYPQGNLSTPLVRLVRQRQLRRLQQSEGNKRVWKYSLP